MLPTTEFWIDVPVLFDILHVEIPSLIGQDVLDENKILIDNETNSPWSRISCSKDQLRFVDLSRMKLTKKSEHPYVPLYTPIQLFYIM